MLEWISANAATIIISLVLIAVVFLIVRKMVKDKRSGKASCGCDCGTCAMSGKCHYKQ